MMHYIDSDGVLHNLMKWFFEKDPDSLYSSDIRSRLLAQYSDEVFLGEQLPGASFYLEMLRTKPDYMVLTSLSAPDKLEPYCSKPVEEVLEDHRRNKYKWFKDRGIPEEKVIITDSYKDKAKYCKPGDILVDDTKGNIEAWEKAGGIGVHLYHDLNKIVF